MHTREKLGTTLAVIERTKIDKLYLDLNKKSDKQLSGIREKYDAPKREKLERMGLIRKIFYTIGEIYGINSSPFEIFDKSEYFVAGHILYQRAWKRKRQF